MTLAVRSVCSCLFADPCFSQRWDLVPGCWWPWQWRISFPSAGFTGWWWRIISSSSFSGNAMADDPKRNWCAAIGLAAGRWSFSMGAENRLAAAPWLRTSKARMLRTWCNDWHLNSHESKIWSVLLCLHWCYLGRYQLNQGDQLEVQEACNIEDSGDSSQGNTLRSEAGSI